jgi:hypothetical protein
MSPSKRAQHRWAELEKNMASRTFTFTHADGRIETRSSKTRVYTHVVLGKPTVEWCGQIGHEKVLQWTMSAGNANKALGGWTANFTGLRVAPVDAA